MRRTSVMIEVDDQVYDSLVEPLKRNKMFAKLISSLLNGYLNDSYVRALVDDNFEDVHKAVVGAFDELADSMEASLANMGLFVDEMEANAKAGYKKFQSKREESAKGLNGFGKVNNDGTGSKDGGNTAPDYVEALSARVDALERTVRDGINQMLKVLEGSVVPKKPTEPDVERGVSQKAESALSQQIRELYDEPKDDFIAGSNETDSDSDDGVSSDDAMSFLSSLIADVGMSY